MRFTRPLTATAILMALAAPAAALTAQATTDLNLRAGPGPQYAVQSVIQTDAAVEISGCITGSEWCKVMVNGQEGWAHSGYLTTSYQNAPTVVYDNYATLALEPMTYVPADPNVKEFTPAGDLIIGTAVPNVPIVIDENVTLQYVQANPVAPVYLNGEVAVGAGLPGDVVVYPVPDTTYSYVNVNDQLVLVEPKDRRIVRILR
ncbi:MAG: DUF1236 domain-containing protein [Pseudooceanicola sp.]|nr:DUF1236 domain-containing protein [Pseudooceanicola sp.]